MARTKYNDKYEYEIFEDGYEIYYDSSIISQRGEYSHPYDLDKSYEENCLMQLEDLSRPFNPTANPEIIRSDVDFLALMMDVELPSEDSKEGE